MLKDPFDRGGCHWGGFIKRPNMRSNLIELVNLAERAARDAGKSILTFYRSNLVIGVKSEGSPLTMTDTEYAWMSAPRPAFRSSQRRVTAEHEPDRVAKIRQYHLNSLITDASDNLLLYQLADYIFFDYSDTPMGAIYTDKNLFLLDVPGAESDPLTGSDSPDVLIRKTFGSVFHFECRIASKLADADMWNEQALMRKKLSKTYFAPYYGFATNAAANTLMRLEALWGHSAPKELR